ncbi:hypothetical protein RIF29_48578 [Crotalaria pallida]|uniref:Uncharacterized protein n=1 Tax=Crotalaria pallida TaxID=3830 RepID=A0AAN9DVK2_CROPI
MLLFSFLQARIRISYDKNILLRLIDPTSNSFLLEKAPILKLSVNYVLLPRLKEIQSQSHSSYDSASVLVVSQSTPDRERFEIARTNGPEAVISGGSDSHPEVPNQDDKAYSFSSFCYFFSPTFQTRFKWSHPEALGVVATFRFRGLTSLFLLWFRASFRALISALIPTGLYPATYAPLPLLYKEIGIKPSVLAKYKTGLGGRNGTAIVDASNELRLRRAAKGTRKIFHSYTEPLTRQVDRQQAQLDLLIVDSISPFKAKPTLRSSPFPLLHRAFSYSHEPYLRKHGDSCFASLAAVPPVPAGKELTLCLVMIGSEVKRALSLVIIVEILLVDIHDMRM